MSREKTQFKPGNKFGQGRPKKVKCIPDILRKIGDEALSEKLLPKVLAMYPNIGKITHLEALQRLVYIYAFKGNSWAVQYIAERTEGKVQEIIEKHDNWTTNIRIEGLDGSVI